MGGGCLREVVAHGGSTVYLLINEFMIIIIFFVYSILSSIVYKANTEIRECVKWSLTRG